MTMTLTRRTKGDTAYPPTITCLANGVGVPLTDLTVTVRMEYGAATKTPAHTLLDQLTHPGELVLALEAEDVDTVGHWAIKVLVVLPDGTRATFRGVFLPIIA